MTSKKENGLSRRDVMKKTGRSLLRRPSPASPAHVHAGSRTRSDRLIGCGAAATARRPTPCTPPDRPGFVPWPTCSPIASTSANTNLRRIPQQVDVPENGASLAFDAYRGPWIP